ncbi:hypothetical protein WCLP8_3560014 [uncultured Gammaproteobacteria bacterium]
MFGAQAFPCPAARFGPTMPSTCDHPVPIAPVPIAIIPPAEPFSFSDAALDHGDERRLVWTVPAPGAFLRLDFEVPPQGIEIEALVDGREIGHRRGQEGVCAYAWRHDVEHGQTVELRFRRSHQQRTDERQPLDHRATISTPGEIRDFLISPLRCYFPFSLVSLRADGTFQPCRCGAWLKTPYAFGNLRTQGVDHIWNGPVMTAMRAEFLAGIYTSHCRATVCPYLSGAETQPAPNAEAIAQINYGRTSLPLAAVSTLIHEVDPGCNLACPMCRPDKILADDANVRRSIEEIRTFVAGHGIRDLTVSGAGEVLAFKSFVRFLAEDFLREHGVRLALITNGTRFDQRLWRAISHNRFATVVVSGDGCTPDTYEQVRRGARWETFQRNLGFLADLRRRGEIGTLVWNWVVMPINIHEIGLAVELARDWGLDQIAFLIQSGSVAETGFGNLFERADLDLLDAVYDQLDRVGAFDDPRVNLESLAQLRRRRYRTVPFRLEAAGFQLDTHLNPASAATIANRCLTDIAVGRLEPPRRLSLPHRQTLANLHQLGLLKFPDAPVPALIEIRQEAERWIASQPPVSREDMAEAYPDRASLIERLAVLVADQPLLIWGAGNTGDRVLALLRGLGVAPVAGFIDTAKTGTHRGLPVRQPERIAEAERARAVVMIGSQSAAEIFRQARSLGYRVIINPLTLL